MNDSDDFIQQNERDDALKELIDEGLVVVRLEPDGTPRYFAAQFAPSEKPLTNGESVSQ